ncbi:MAG: hypothetical protein U5K43_13605 [Halofilum sp. (in: g-proteobacteria)]|nr:hypothetical protein [Halofilum sp. (in: g-proteobacteria)]
MDPDSLEYRSAAIARALAISLNDPDRADLGRLAASPELHPTTRARIGYLRQFRDAMRDGRSLDELELRFVATMAEALEGLLGIRTVSGPPAHPRRRASDRPRHAGVDA